MRVAAIASAAMAASGGAHRALAMRFAAADGLVGVSVTFAGR